MGLRDYFAKRKFNRTPEPKGQVKKSPSKTLRFVVQKHHASQLHYDFRLELDGVLKSWAVPKGPSLNPHDKHLAMQVEDHPFDYRNFEGVIPKGGYGAGNVIIWDEGTYEPRATTDDPQRELRKGLKKGHLTFVLHGQKLRGEFALIKMHGKDEHAWLLVKKDDEFATTDDVTAQDQSVKTGRKVDDLGASGKLPDLADYPKKSTPWHVKPMLCTLVDKPFTKQDWLFEIKWDGYRAIGSKKGSAVDLYSRTGQDFSAHYPPVYEALHNLDHDVIIDGEIVVIDKNGTPHFEWLQNYRDPKRRNPQGTLAYYVFDLLWCDGHDLRDAPLVTRKQLLAAIIPKNSAIRYSDHIMAQGEAMFAQVQQRGLEGIVAKKADSNYREGNRGHDWLKIKTHQRQEVVIGGFTEPRGSRKYFGSLLLGVYDGDDFVYVGHSGGGFTDSELRDLHAQLVDIERDSSPFAVKPKPNAPVHWVQPRLVAEVTFTEWTNDGSMRHPVFVGMRTDKKPHDVRREQSKTSPKIDAKKEPIVAKSSSKGPELTHLDKIFFPKHKYTKGDLIDYYRSVADYILPYIKDRPLSLLRQPGGADDKGFFQKNMPHLPTWVPSVDIYSQSHGGNMHWMVGGDINTLLYAVQLGSIEINPFNARVGHLDNPDWLVVDLDPEGVTFNDVINVAQTVKQVCDGWQVPSYPKTSGKTGLHIYVPLGAKYTHDQARDFAHLLVIEVNKRQPKITSIERNPAKRQRKIYLDYLQNRHGQTLAAPYSVRPTPDATVSMPLHWDEVVKGLSPSQFTIKNIHKRLSKTGDLWKPVVDKGVDIGDVLKRLQP